MPTNIRINVPESAQSRHLREQARERFIRGNMLAPVSARPWGDGIAQLRGISSAEARVILSDLRTQLQGRNGTKSGYLKLMNTRQVGRDRMVIERKSRVQTWFSSEGKMARSGQAILDLLRKSGAASPQQLQDLETYLNRRGMAGTRAVAELLNRIDLDADPYAAIGADACRQRGDTILSAWQAAGLAPSDGLQAFMVRYAETTPLTIRFGFKLLGLLVETEPTPTAAQAGIVIRALLDSDDRSNPAANIVVIGTLLTHYHRYLVESLNQQQRDPDNPARASMAAAPLSAQQSADLFADLLLESTRGHEHQLPVLLQACSQIGSAEWVPLTAGKLRQAIEAREPAIANVAQIVQRLDAVDRVDLTLNTQLSLENQAWDEPTLAQAAQVQNQLGFIKVNLERAANEVQANEAQANGRAATLLRDFLAQSFARGMTVSGRFAELPLGSPPPQAPYRLVNSLIALAAAPAAVQGDAQPATPVLNLRQSSIQQSVINLMPEPELRVDLQQAQLDGSILTLDIRADSNLRLSGLETASLDGTNILLTLSGLRQQLDEQSARTQTETLTRLFIGRPGVVAQADVARIIQQLPERYASLKVSLFLQVLNEALEGRPDLALHFAAKALRDEPRLLTNPAVRRSIDEILHQIAEFVWTQREAPLAGFARYERLCQGVPVLRQLLDAHPDFARFRLLNKAQTDPRACREDLEPVLRTLTSLNEAQRQGWMMNNLGAANILLHRAAAVGNPEWDADGGLRRTLMNTLVSVPVVARALDFYMQDIAYVEVSQTPAERQQQRIDQYDQGGIVPFGRSGRHFALLSREALDAMIARQPIDGFFARPDAMLTIDQGAGDDEAITPAHQRAFDRFRDAKLDPILGEAVRLQGAHILSERPDERFPAEIHAKLADRHAQGQNNQTLNDQELDALYEYQIEIRAEGVEARIANCDRWGEPVLSPQHLQNLRAHMLAAGIPDGDANFSGYLLALASVYARLSSAAGFGTEDESIQPLRGYSHALLNHAKLIGDQFTGADRRIPEAAMVDEVARRLRSNQCANILSADVMLPLVRSHAPDIFDWLTPSGWRHLGARETNVLRALRSQLAENPVAPA